MKSHACVGNAYALSDASPKLLGALHLSTGLEAAIVCLTMPLLEVDNYAYDALMQEC